MGLLVREFFGDCFAAVVLVGERQPENAVLCFQAAFFHLERPPRSHKPIKPKGSLKMGNIAFQVADLLGKIALSPYFKPLKGSLKNGKQHFQAANNSFGKTVAQPQSNQAKSSLKNPPPPLALH